MTTTREVYPAVVASTDDPEKRGRIRVTCLGIMGDTKTTMAQWIQPIFDWGWFYVPDVGELVEIEIHTSSTEDESRGQFSIDNMDPRWRGSQYFGNEKGDKPRPVPADFTAANYGKRRGFATPGGHVLMFDDTDGKRELSISWSDKDGKLSLMVFDKDGSINLNTHSGHSFKMDAAAGEILLKDSNDNEYKSDSAGVTIKCENAVIEATKIELGSSGLSEALILGTTFINSIYNAHIHPTGVGPSGPPVTPAPSSILSTKSFVE